MPATSVPARINGNSSPMPLPPESPPKASLTPEIAPPPFDWLPPPTALPFDPCPLEPFVPPPGEFASARAAAFWPAAPCDWSWLRVLGGIAPLPLLDEPPDPPVPGVPGLEG